MNKFLAIAILGLGVIAFNSGTAEAGWLRDKCAKCKCCKKVCAKQYNAFSPWCLDGPVGCMAGNCNTWACNDGGCGHEAPAHGHDHAMMNQMPAGQNGQGWTEWAPGMTNPTGVPSYFSGSTGFATVNSQPQ